MGSVCLQLLSSKARFGFTAGGTGLLCHFKRMFAPGKSHCNDPCFAFLHLSAPFLILHTGLSPPSPSNGWASKACHLIAAHFPSAETSWLRLRVLAWVWKWESKLKGSFSLCFCCTICRQRAFPREQGDGLVFATDRATWGLCKAGAKLLSLRGFWG